MILVTGVLLMLVTQRSSEDVYNVNVTWVVLCCVQLQPKVGMVAGCLASLASSVELKPFPTKRSDAPWCAKADNYDHDHSWGFCLYED